MTPNPLPFISSLRTGADAFANTVTLLALCTGGVFVVWVGLHAFGVRLDAPPATLRVWTVIACSAWFVFYACCYLIDYTIYAVSRAATEWLWAALHHETNSDQDVDPGPTPPQRDAAIVYLRDFLDTLKATDSAPLNPEPPKAA